MATQLIELYHRVLQRESLDQNDDSVADALKIVRDAYKAVSRNKESVAVDYNEAKNRYVYIYYYAVCHTLMVSRQTMRMLLKKPWTICRLMGYEKEELNICSLGGGPGCDLIGLLRTRSLVGLSATKKINCTVIDICHGWQRSLKNVLSAYLDTSEGDIYREKVRFELVRSDLLACPPRLIALKRIANTDILTLVKFVSAVPAERTSAILQLFFHLLKRGAYVLFLDNANGNSFQTTELAAKKAGLSNVCKIMDIEDAGKVSSIGPLKMNSKPMKSTRICSSIWHKL